MIVKTRAGEVFLTLLNNKNSRGARLRDPGLPASLTHLRRVG
jgi:hypothetical protein